MRAASSFGRWRPGRPKALGEWLVPSRWECLLAATQWQDPWQGIKPTFADHRVPENVCDLFSVAASSAYCLIRPWQERPSLRGDPCRTLCTGRDRTALAHFETWPEPAAHNPDWPCLRGRPHRKKRLAEAPPQPARLLPCGYPWIPDVPSVRRYVFEATQQSR